MAEASSGQQAAVLQHGAQVVAHAHLANELLGAGGNADFEVLHPGGHHQLGQLGIKVVGADVSRPTDVIPALLLHRPQELLGVFDVAAGWDELGVGEPEATHTALIKLTHLSDDFINGVHPHRLAFNNGVNAITTVMGTTSLGLHADVEVARFEVPVELRPNRFDVVVIAGGFDQTRGLLMDQARARRFAGAEATLTSQ